MTDFWGFLLQTMTASGVAAVLLVVKAMFRDKLSPRWQFAAWGVLALILLVPAGQGGRYVLVNWPWLVEAAKTVLAGDYSLTHVLAPIPLLRFAPPETAADWLYSLYAAGAALLLARYLISYFRLRLTLRRGMPAAGEQSARIAAVAERYGLSSCRAVEVPGLTSAFICGVFRPVLALPAGIQTDDKVILHELIHLRQRDAVWGLVICLLRCLHWCNPLLWYCADRAGNDLEERCDQRVLELLEGEERRDYGRILLSMANEKYARAPGTTSMANGGKNIRRRIESIARFKRYPAGMALASVCVTVILTVPLLLGTRALGIYEDRYYLPADWNVKMTMASARTVYCTTYAGAMDAYAKSVLNQNGFYRAMCAPIEEQGAIADTLLRAAEENRYPAWDPGLPCWPNSQRGYRIYNLEPVGGDAYEGLLAVELNYPPDGQPSEGQSTWLAAQRVRAERREARWVVLPLEDFWAVQTDRDSLPIYVCEEFPAWRYEAQAEGFILRLSYQTSYAVDSYQKSSSWVSSYSTFDTTPRPNGTFSCIDGQDLKAIYTGDPADKGGIISVGVSVKPLDGEERSSVDDSSGFGSEAWRYLSDPTANAGGSSTDGSSWGTQSLEGEDWETQIGLCGGGGTADPEHFDRERGYHADLYINGRKRAELTLMPVEGGAVLD